MHISKIIDYVKNEIRFSQEFCEDNVFVTLRIEPISKIIENLEQSHKDILELTKEIEQKDKQIDLMLDKIDMTKPSPCTMTNEYSIGRVYMSKEEKRQYFETKAKKGE